MENFSFGTGGAFQKKFHATLAGFFDRARVVNKLDRYERRVLSRFGAFVRRKAKSSIKDRPGASAPGSPPHTHEFYFEKAPKKPGAKPRRRFYFRDSILFSLEEAPGKKGVVIGPYLFNGASDPSAIELEEKGGVITRTLGKKRVVQVYPPRPYMKPAFDEVVRLNLANILRDARG